MRDWVESKESGLSPQKHRAILNVAIVTLSALLLALLMAEAFFLYQKGASKLAPAAMLAELQTREEVLLELDNVLARGNIIHEFAANYLASDSFQADIISARLARGRQILLSDAAQFFPQATVQDLVRMLGLYLSYQPGSIEHLVDVPVPLNPQVDTQALVTGLLALRAYQQEWVSGLATIAVDRHEALIQQGQFLFALLLLCLIPLAAGVYVSQKFAREHQNMLNTRVYFKRLINALPGVVLLTDRAGNVISASQAAADFLSYSRDQLSQMDMAALLPKRFRQQYQLFSKNHIDAGAERDGARVKGRELLVLNAEGVEVPVELYFGDFDTAGGGVLVVCLHDVTERRHLYQQYQHSQKRFEMAMMASRDGLWDWDMVNDSVFFSPAWLQMMGIRGGQPLDGRVVFDDSIHPDDRVRVRADIERFVKSDETLFRDEHRLRRRDGTVCDAVTRACAQRDSSGQVIRIVGMHSDVTHFKEAEREVRRLNRNLEDRVRLRTQQLETALLQAEAANRTKATFLAVMGHEIRTPMNGVIGMADLLSKTKLDREQRMMIDTVRRSSMSLLGTLDNILDYSALDSGDVELESESIQLVEFVEGVADEFAERAAKNKLRFILHIDPSVPAAVFADATRLRKILANLLDNAVKFTHAVAGGGVIQLRLNTSKSRSGPRQRIEFEVIDNGIGVSREMRKQLFKPFMLEENSRARRFGGTGLGLAISTRLLQLMGGEITLDENLEQGSRFVFSIPFTVDTSSKRIAAAEGVTVLACLSEGLLKESVHAALALDGRQTVWLQSAGELADHLNALNADNTVLILAEGDSSDLAQYAEKHQVKVIYISPRPNLLKSLDPSKVYCDPLLPSALARAVEYRPRATLDNV